MTTEPSQPRQMDGQGFPTGPERGAGRGSPLLTGPDRQMDGDSPLYPAQTEGQGLFSLEAQNEACNCCIKMLKTTMGKNRELGLGRTQLHRDMDPASGQGGTQAEGSSEPRGECLSLGLQSGCCSSGRGPAQTLPGLGLRDSRSSMCLKT